jgi:hypothetical protein
LRGILAVDAKQLRAIRFRQIYDTSKARRELKEAIDQGRDVQFSAEEVELLVRQGEAARDMASLFIAAVSGDSGTDWDAELYELEQRRQWGAEWKEE